MASTDGEKRPRSIGSRRARLPRGSKTLRQIGEEYGCSHVAVKKRAKDGPDLSVRIKEAAEAKSYQGRSYQDSYQRGRDFRAASRRGQCATVGRRGFE